MPAWSIVAHSLGKSLGLARPPILAAVGEPFVRTRTNLREAMSTVLSSSVRDKCGNRLEEDLDVQPEPPAVDVNEIPFNPSIEVCFLARLHLPQTGDAWLHRQATAMPDVVAVMKTSLRPIDRFRIVLAIIDSTPRSALSAPG